MNNRADAIVLGGGIFGSSIALQLRETGMENVVLLEAEDTLMTRASWANQARIHNGYHYPRSRATALSCRENYARFLHDYRGAVRRSERTLYAIARNSKVAATQFQAFCDDVDIPCHVDDAETRSLFDFNAVEAVFQVEEAVFDAVALRQDFERRLHASGVEVHLACRAKVASWSKNRVEVSSSIGTWKAHVLVNATYASLDQVGVEIRSKIKRELAEIAMVRLPKQLSETSITVMDGPYFSTLPFPSQNVHSLSHVRFTPHCEWTNSASTSTARKASHFSAMIADAAHYVPLMESAVYQHSMFETKAVLQANEHDDGRPILIERHPESDRIFSILGAKIDNLYDAVDAVSQMVAHLKKSLEIE